MCIRDRNKSGAEKFVEYLLQKHAQEFFAQETFEYPLANGCLLYTSDAADERSSVDLGGRRIIKKKKNKKSSGGRSE